MERGGDASTWMETAIPTGRKKGGEILGWFFVCFPFCKNCKAQGEKKGGSECHQTPINKKNHNKLSQQQIGGDPLLACLLFIIHYFLINSRRFPVVGKHFLPTYRKTHPIYTHKHMPPVRTRATHTHSTPHRKTASLLIAFSFHKKVLVFMPPRVRKVLWLLSCISQDPR